MKRDFWNDLYPVSETRRRFARSAFRQIYLPVILGALLAVGLGVVVVGFPPGGDYTQSGQVATIAMSIGLLAAGFLAWLGVLACLWVLHDALEALPRWTGVMRLRIIPVARIWRRNIHAAERAATAVFRFFKIELKHPDGSREETGRRRRDD